MADNQVKIRVGADLQAAEAAIDVFAKQTPASLRATKESADEIAAAFSNMTRYTMNADQAAALFAGQTSRHLQDVDKSLLNSHQSVHLLAEEMGIHLPRAVVSAVSEVLPSIGTLGGAMLGAFAVEKVWNWSTAAVDAFHRWYTATSADVQALDDAAAKAFKDITQQEEEMLAHFHSSLAGEFNIREIDARAAQLERYHEAYVAWEATGNQTARDFISLGHETMQAITEAKKEGLDDLASVDQKMNEVGALQFEAHKQLAKVTKDEDHALCDAAKKDLADVAKAATAADAVARRIWETERGIHQERFRAMQEAGKALAQEATDDQKKIANQEFINKLDLDFLHTLDAISGVQERQVAIARTASPTVQLQGEYDAVRHLSAGYSEYLLAKQDAIKVGQAFTEAIKTEIAAVNDDMLGSLKNLAEGAIGLTGSQKIASQFKAGYEFACGLADLAEGTWPPNPAAIVAAGIHFEAAAQFALLAGKGGRGRPSAGGGGAGAGATGYRGPGSGYGSQAAGTPPQTLAPGAGGSGGRYGSPGSGVIVVHGSQDLHQWVAGLVNGAVNRGITVMATSSQRGSPVGH